MWNSVAALLLQCTAILKDALLVLILPADIFFGLAIITKGLKPTLAAAQRAIRETRINLSIYILDALVVGPILLVLYALMTNFADAYSLRLINPFRCNVTGKEITIRSSNELDRKSVV